MSQGQSHNLQRAILGSLGVLALAAAWRLSRDPKLPADPYAGKVIGMAPDPSASYLPENRTVDAEGADWLRKAVTGR